MSQRSFCYMIGNASQNLSITLRQGRVCGGQWTPGLLPPQSIGPGATASLECEDDGTPFSGTEGWVKYDVSTINVDGTIPGATTSAGMFYLYWHTPYFANTSFRIATDINDVTPDCDPGSSPGGGSTFSDSAPGSLPFEMRGDFIGSPGEDVGTVVQNLSAVALGALAAAFFGGGVLAAAAFYGLGLVAVLNDVYPHATVEIGLTPASSAAQSFGESVGVSSVKPWISATDDSWVGNYISDDGKTEIDITKVPVSTLAAQLGRPTQLRANIVDNSTGESFSNAYEFSLGSEINRTTLQNVLGKTAFSPESAIDHAKSPRLDEIAPPRAGSQVTRHVALTNQVASEIDSLGHALVILDEGVACTLYQIFEGNVQTAKQILFLRFDSSGPLFTNRTLRFEQKIS